MNGEQVAAVLADACRRVDEAYDAWKANQRSDALWGEYTTAQRTASDMLRVNLPTILAHLRAQSPEAVERAAEAMSMNNRERWGDADETEREMWRDDARAALRAAVTP